jgi:O-antigen/teichoic acid export membrane protein
MTAPVVSPDRRGFRAPGTTFMISGGLIGAVGAYLFQLYGGRVLGPEVFAPISILWTTFFILATVLLVPVEQYVTREVASGRKALPHDLAPAGVMMAIGGVLGAGFVWLNLDSLFEGRVEYVIQIVLLIIAYGLLFVGKGVLAGARRFSDVGWVMIVETTTRLFAGIGLLALVMQATSLGWAMVIGGFTVAALRWWRYDTGEERSDEASAGSFLAGYAGGTASSQLLLAGAPLAVAGLGASPALISIVFVTFTLFRAPLTLIFALQGRILPYLVGLAHAKDNLRLGRIARLVVLYGALLALAGGLVGWLVGPEVVSLLYGEEFLPGQTMAMFAAAGVMAAAAAQIASQVLVAEGRTRRLALAWLGGLASAIVALLLLGGEPDVRVAGAFVAGEFAALGLMALLAIRR